MNQTYLSLKYPQQKLFGFFMYFYNTKNEIVAVVDTRNDEIIEDYDE
jgi:hypothetical protein